MVEKTYDGPTADVFKEVWRERQRQEQLRESGKFSHTCATAGVTHDRCNTILGEEVGEVAKAINEGDIFYGLRTELIQVAAVAVAWVERLDAETLVDRERAVRAAQKPAHAAERARQAGEARQATPIPAYREEQPTPKADAALRRLEEDPDKHQRAVAALLRRKAEAEAEAEAEAAREAAGRQSQAHQLARDVAKLDFVTPPPESADLGLGRLRELLKRVTGGAGAGSSLLSTSEWNELRDEVEAAAILFKPGKPINPAPSSNGATLGGVAAAVHAIPGVVRVDVRYVPPWGVDVDVEISDVHGSLEQLTKQIREAVDNARAMGCHAEIHIDISPRGASASLRGANAADMGGEG